jgi:outer membrane immunogenic protein
MRLFAVSALALATLATPAFAQEASSTFTGPHVEIISGWDHAGGFGVGSSGVAYGGVVGYDTRIGGAVIGAEGEVTGSTVEESGVSAGVDFSVGARLGYAVTNSTLVYAKGGYTNARINVGALGADYDGYRVGAGVEHSFGRFLGKVEYRYSRYDSAHINRDQVMAGLGIRF